MLNSQSTISQCGIMAYTNMQAPDNNLTSRLEGARNRIAALIDRASSVANKLCGPIPEVVAEKKMPTIGGCVGSLDELHDDLTRLESHLSRIENTV